ncbi:hypothetical protein [Pseudopelagicola sp. nBUS_19]|mgnify:CR=1 FL=1|uniref:hypothetical protein n=1 Tax=unclassified Pseudopelagicola TaxID=2649563 RepID=UPI003EB8EC13
MENNKPPKIKPAKVSKREERLKTALKANMSRRKAQARARAASNEGQNETGHSEGQK